MKLSSLLKSNGRGIAKAVRRFPAALAFLTAIAALNAISIHNSDYAFERAILPLATGVFFAAVAQILYERFFKGLTSYFLSLLSVLVLTAGDFFLVFGAGKIGNSIRIRTAVIVFALFLAFILIPSIKSGDDFCSLFMTHFKAIFTSAFFSGVLFGGVSLIILAIDSLLFRVNSDTYAYLSDIVWVIVAPLLYFSLLPVFSGNGRDPDRVRASAQCPRFLETLISWVLVPLLSVYTVVLLIYMVKTLAVQNWTDRYLVPLVLSYCIAVLVLYFLSGGLNGKIAVFYRAVFPKLLILVSIFQIAASCINAATAGIVPSRYFVLLFGTYSLVCGVLLSLFPRRAGLAAALAVVFAVVSVTPPVDAFTASNLSQKRLFYSVLEKDGMISGNKIVPNSNILQKDRETIRNSVLYFCDYGEMRAVPILPSSFEMSDFESTFGFAAYGSASDKTAKNVSCSLGSEASLSVEGYDVLCPVSFSMRGESGEEKLFTFSDNGGTYTVYFAGSDSGAGTLKVRGSGGSEIFSVALDPMLKNIIQNGSNDSMSANDMTFDAVSGNSSFRVIFKNVDIMYDSAGSSYSDGNCEAYLLFSMK